MTNLQTRHYNPILLIILITEFKKSRHVYSIYDYFEIAVFNITRFFVAKRDGAMGIILTEGIIVRKYKNN